MGVSATALPSMPTTSQFARRACRDGECPRPKHLRRSTMSESKPNRTLSIDGAKRAASSTFSSSGRFPSCSFLTVSRLIATSGSDSASALSTSTHARRQPIARAGSANHLSDMASGLRHVPGYSFDSPLRSPDRLRLPRELR
eukprot:1257698-Prymnesium_polylepis.2